MWLAYRIDDNVNGKSKGKASETLLEIGGGGGRIRTCRV